MRALIIGATGLVGHQILELLLNDSEFKKVDVFVRRKTGISHPKLTEHVVDFERFADWESSLQGDVLFSAMGTTLKSAGSKEAQYKVDFEYQYQVARAAQKNGASGIVLISSTGASASSPFFYLKTKGQLEDAINSLGFKRVGILRPGPLTGEREVPRPTEKLSLAITGAIPKWKLFSTLLPVTGHRVAQRALQLAKSQNSFKILEAKHILWDEEV